MTMTFCSKQYFKHMWNYHQYISIFTSLLTEKAIPSKSIIAPKLSLFPSLEGAITSSFTEMDATFDFVILFLAFRLDFIEDDVNASATGERIKADSANALKVVWVMFLCIIFLTLFRHSLVNKKSDQLYRVINVSIQLLHPNFVI